MVNDLRYALRMLAKNRCFAAMAVLTLALGIGVNTAIFSVVNGVLLKPLPYQQPGQLVMVFEDETGDGRGKNAVAGGVFLDWKEHATSFEALSVISGTDMNLTGSGQPERVNGLQVSASTFFPVFLKSWLSVVDQRSVPGRSPLRDFRPFLEIYSASKNTKSVPDENLGALSVSGYAVLRPSGPDIKGARMIPP